MLLQTGLQMRRLASLLARSIGTEWVVPRMGLVILTAIPLAVMGAQNLIAHRIADTATKVAIQCAVIEPVVEGSRAALGIKCGERDLVLEDADVIVSYLKRPGSLSCDVAASGRFWCKARE